MEFLNLNVGTGIGTTVLELVRTFEKINNVKIPFVFDKRRLGDASFVVADNSLLTSKINFKHFRTIEEMCRDGWRWKQLNPEGY